MMPDAAAGGCSHISQQEYNWAGRGRENPPKISPPQISIGEVT